MSDFMIFSDSACDLPEELLYKFHLNIIPFYVSFDGENYLKENIDISSEEFYKRLEEEEFPKTSLPSIDDYIADFKPALMSGLDVLCICISSSLSGSYQSAYNAKKILEDDFPNRKILILDSKQATGAQGLLLLQALKMKKDGLNINEIYEKLEKLKETTRIYFTPDKLEYLKKGGRIGKASATVGSLLNVKPILYLENGEVTVKSKVRGKNKAIAELISVLQEIPEKELNNYDFIVGGSCCKDDTIDLLVKVEEMLGIRIRLPIFNVGVTVGTHVGPEALGIAFIQKYETI